jgi:16S rRNA (cytidine1402-2'-O)-methyltransferase
MEKGQPHTLIFYESPFRLEKLLLDALGVLGDRLAAVCIELTKQFEKVHRGSLSELAALFRDQKVRGEITVVIAGNNPKFAVEEASSDEDSGELDEDPPEDD